MKLPILLISIAATMHAQQPASTVPVGADGKPLNLGFESGTLEGWTAEGDAFAGQPVEGDTVAKRRADMRSAHAGKFWVGTYERKVHDDPMGVLTSPAFRATQPWASFLVGGGDWPETRVEVVSKEDGKVIHTARGVQQEAMARSVVDLTKVQGKEIFLRIVDQKKGHWGHINFDDFVFHAEKPKFAASAVAAVALAPDAVEHAGLPADKAAQVAMLPPGYEMAVFAAEPDIINPVSFAIDERARMWVVEGMTYPNRVKEPVGTPPGMGGKDRILVFEDTDGDGKHDKRTVFMEGLNLVSGIEVGYGGIFVGAAPYMLYIPVENGDAPKPKGPPQVVLDGWGYQDTHETLNSFRWGPDGWLYGCHGVFTHSEVGAPGTAKEQRVKINAGVWRMHPVTKKFEVFAHGTSNPWGIDWNADGALFAEACVIPHLFHIIDGGRYHRQAGSHFNTNTYEDIKTIADHRHYLGGNPHGGNGKSDAAGGGHAHAGLAIPQHPSWPDSIRGNVLMGNIHGARINMDIPERKGSGYVAKHGADFLNFHDKASQIVDIREGPDGALYMIDWYDINQCHNNTRERHDYTTGRVYRVAKKGAKLVPVDMARLSTKDLAAAVIGADPMRAKVAARLLLERAQDIQQLEAVHEAMSALGESALPAGADKEAAARRAQQLTAALYSGTNAAQVGPDYAASQLKRIAGAQVGGSGLDWLIRFAATDSSLSKQAVALLPDLAAKTDSPVIRLAIASVCQRLTVEQRKPIVMALLGRAEDKDDQNLPLMYWYAAEPIAGADPIAAAELLEACKIPKIQEFIARRMAGK